MHSHSCQVCVQTVSIPLLRPAHIITSQELHSATVWANSQSKKKLTSSQASQTQEKESGSSWKEVTTDTDPPTVAKSPTQLINNFIGITTRFHGNYVNECALPPRVASFPRSLCKWELLACPHHWTPADWFYIKPTCIWKLQRKMTAEEQVTCCPNSGSVWVQKEAQHLP